jgi:trypsin
MLKILIVLAVAAISKADINRFVVGGKNADISEVPYQVALMRDGNFTCGGSIISKSYILTAAHCVTDKPDQPNHYTVRVGSSYSDKEGTVIKVAKFLVHPNYNNPKLSNDFALLKLETPIKEFDSNVKSILLASPDQKLVLGSLATVSGYGRLGYHGNRTKRLQKVKIPLADWEYCRARYVGRAMITEQVLCAGTGKGSCHGESFMIIHFYHS